MPRHVVVHFGSSHHQDCILCCCQIAKAEPFIPENLLASGKEQGFLSDSLRKVYGKNAGASKDSSRAFSMQRRKMMNDNPEIKKEQISLMQQMRNDPFLKSIREQKMAL